MMLLKKYKALIILGACAPLFLSGCARDLSEPSWISGNSVQVQEHSFVEEVALSDVTNEFVSKTAKHYNKYGGGPVNLSVTYNPNIKGSSSIKASGTAAKIAASFRSKGVRDVEIDVLPVGDQGQDAKLILSYTSYTAHAPKDCGVLYGFDDNKNNINRDYEMGCTIETVMARQIARPKDLLGVGSVNPTTDGRRSGNIVETYRTGAPNEALDGLSASE